MATKSLLSSWSLSHNWSSYVLSLIRHRGHLWFWHLGVNGLWWWHLPWLVAVIFVGSIIDYHEKLQVPFLFLLIAWVLKFGTFFERCSFNVFIDQGDFSTADNVLGSNWQDYTRARRITIGLCQCDWIGLGYFYSNVSFLLRWNVACGLPSISWTLWDWKSIGTFVYVQIELLMYLTISYIVIYLVCDKFLILFGWPGWASRHHLLVVARQKSWFVIFAR